MLLDDFIADLQTLRQQYGNIPVVDAMNDDIMPSYSDDEEEPVIVIE